MTGRTPTMISDECEKLETIKANGYPGNVSKHEYLRLSNLRTQTPTFCKNLDRKLQTRRSNKLLASEFLVFSRL